MTKSVANKNHDTILQCCLVKNLVRDLFMGKNNGTKLLVLPLLFLNPQSLHISLEFKNLFEVLSFLEEDSICLLVDLWIIQSFYIVFLELLQGSSCQTCVRHGCRWLVHWRCDSQKDLLSPGDPAWAQRETPAERVTATARQSPLPAFAIATRKNSSVSDTW